MSDISLYPNHVYYRYSPTGHDPTPDTGWGRINSINVSETNDHCGDSIDDNFN
jgi:hypothetical protein